mgnify:CR=1 FL=1
MNEKRWILNKEMLDVLRLIRENCKSYDTCAGCPLADLDDFHLCKLGNQGGVPEYWNLEELEAERDG